MAKSTPLFLLIKSLSKTEKRYFKLFAGQQGDAQNYLKIFEFIDKMEAYDEQLLREKFAGEPFLKHLHVTKNYLYKLILKGMRNYHSHKTVHSKIQNNLLDIEILHRRELFGQAEKIVDRTIELARRYEKREDLLARRGDQGLSPGRDDVGRIVELRLASGVLQARERTSSRAISVAGSR